MRHTIKDLHVVVRLHPREREKEQIFAEELSQYEVQYDFDHSKNWLEGNKINNLIVISPWSSTLEDAYDNGFTSVTIDQVGKERYKHLLDGIRFFYSDNLVKTLSEIQETQTA